MTEDEAPTWLDTLAHMHMGDLALHLVVIVLIAFVVALALYWVIRFAVQAGVLSAHDVIEKERTARENVASAAASYAHPPAPPRP